MSEDAAKNPSNVDGNTTPLAEESLNTSAFETFEMSATAQLSDPIEQLLATSDSTIAAGFVSDDLATVGQIAPTVSSEVAPKVIY